MDLDPLSLVVCNSLATDLGSEPPHPGGLQFSGHPIVDLDPIIMVVYNSANLHVLNL